MKTRRLAIPWLLLTVLLAATATAAGIEIAQSPGIPTTVQLTAELIGASGIGPGWRTESLQSRETKDNWRSGHCFTDKTSLGGPTVDAHYLDLSGASVVQEVLTVPAVPPIQVIDSVIRCGVSAQVEDVTTGKVTKLHEMRSIVFEGIGDSQVGYLAILPDHGQRRIDADVFVAVGNTLAIFTYSGFSTALQTASLVNQAAEHIQ